MRKTMTKEVTATTVKMSKLEVQNGEPSLVEMDDIVMIGNVSLEKAQKEVRKEYGENVTVFEVTPETTVYVMSVDEFIKLAEVKQPEPETEESEAV